MSPTPLQPTDTPTGASAAPPRPGWARAFGWRIAAFIALFIALQAGWEAARGTWLERLWVHEFTVRAATSVINQLTPEVGATARASRIVAPGGGLNVLLGCEGTDVVFMLVAAFAVFPLPWRARLAGAALGLVWVYVLNQARIVALFYAFREQRELFDTLHTVAAPLVVVALTAGYFQWWLHRSGQTRPAAA